MTVLYLVVVPWLSLSLLAAALLIVAGVRRERRREAKRRHPSFVGRRLREARVLAELEREFSEHTP